MAMHPRRGSRRAARALVAGMTFAGTHLMGARHAQAALCYDSEFGPYRVVLSAPDQLNWGWPESARIRRFTVFNVSPAFAPYPDDHGVLELYGYNILYDL